MTLPVRRRSLAVTPAKAGVHGWLHAWIPPYAGMTNPASATRGNNKGAPMIWGALVGGAFVRPTQASALRLF